MKPFILCFFVVLFSALSSGAQTKKDTSFLLREFLTDQSYHAVFIDHAKNSRYYTLLRDLSIDTRRYTDIIAELKDSLHEKVVKHPFPNFPHRWFPLSLYKGNYYLYSASDNGMNDWVKLTDTTFIQNYFDDGAVPALIRSIKKIGSHTTEILLASTRGIKKVYIHIINPVKGIAVFEYPDDPGEWRYRLMIDLDKIEQYPVIVNYCKESRTIEWDFDVPDFKKLLEKK